MRSISTGVLGAAVSIMAGACHPSFDVTETGQGTVNASPVPFVNDLVPLGFSSLTSFDLSQTQEFENQGVSKSQLSSVKLQSATLSVSAPEGGNFDFLQSIEFDVSADGQPTKSVAVLSAVPKGQSQISLSVEDVELLPYVAASSMSVTTSATGSPPSQDTTINATLVFEVVPNL